LKKKKKLNSKHALFYAYFGTGVNKDPVMCEMGRRPGVGVNGNKNGPDDRQPLSNVGKLPGDVFIVVLVFNVDKIICRNLLFMNGVVCGGEAEPALVCCCMRTVMRACQAKTKGQYVKYYSFHSGRKNST
jgi:hypothetical protein